MLQYMPIGEMGLNHIFLNHIFRFFPFSSPQSLLFVLPKPINLWKLANLFSFVVRTVVRMKRVGVILGVTQNKGRKYYSEPLLLDKVELHCWSEWCILTRQADHILIGRFIPWSLQSTRPSNPGQDNETETESLYEMLSLMMVSIWIGECWINNKSLHQYSSFIDKMFGCVEFEGQCYGFLQVTSWRKLFDDFQRNICCITGMQIINWPMLKVLSPRSKKGCQRTLTKL